MNEKIKQLAEQAGFHVADGKIYIPTTSEDITECQKKFAELIVRECSRVAKLKIGHNKVCDAIEQHFGVE